MVGAMACLIVNDSIVKYASHTIPAGQLIFVRGVITTLLILLVVRATKTSIVVHQMVSGWVALRAVIDALATLAYLIALFHLPIAHAISIYMVSPLLISLLEMLRHGIGVGAERWIIILAGFGGVLLITQPAAGGFNAFTLLCLLGALLSALRDLVTPHIESEVPTITITLATAAAVTLLAGGMSFVQGWTSLTAAQLGWLTAAAVFLASGYHLAIRATRVGELSVVAPFRYSGLLMAAAIGWLVWGEWPDGLAWVGIGLITGAGLLLLRRS
jgi:drug/metabolite transporter (DMT)-like permease